jgi:hypothetical protein
MSKASDLQKAAVNLSALRQDGQRELVEMLDKLSGSKCLVLDPSLGGPLNIILSEGSQMLKDHDVKDFKELNSDELKTDCDNVMYLVRPDMALMKQIANQVKSSGRNSGKKSTYVYFVPRRTLICEEVLKNEGVFKHLHIGEYRLDLIPFDDDILTLELESSFTECHLNGDRTSLMNVALSIMKLQNMFGLIPNVKVKGTLSKAVLDLLTRMRREQGADEMLSPESEIDTLVLIDRQVDLVTPLLTPLTYEGLIDEFITIQNSYIKVDPKILEDDDDADSKKHGDKPVTLALNSNDTLYADIRNYNVQKLGGYLQEKAKQIQEQYANFRGNKKGMELTDMKAFVRKIPELQKTYKSLTNHIAVVELIKTRTSTPEFNELWQTERTMLEGDQEYDKIEEMMAVQQPLVKVLRLLCLQSLTNGGIKAKAFDHLRRELLQTWGFELLFTLNNLEKLEMLKKKDSSWLEKESNWDQLRNGLNLINEDVDAFEPDDISYVTSGYAPLTCRLVEHVVKHGGWSGIKEQMRKLAGTAGTIVLSCAAAT